MDIVLTSQEAEALDRSPLLVLDRLEAFLDEHGSRQRADHGESHRRRRRLELHVPARARRRAPRAPPPTPPAAPAFSARHGARGAAATRTRTAGHPPAGDRRRGRRRERPGRALLRDAVPRGSRRDPRAATRARGTCRTPSARARPRRHPCRDPRGRCHPTRARRVRSVRQLPRAPGAAFYAAVGGQPHAGAPSGRRGREPARGPAAGRRFPQPSSTATTGSGT